MVLTDSSDFNPDIVAWFLKLGSLLKCAAFLFNKIIDRFTSFPKRVRYYWYQMPHLFFIVCGSVHIYLCAL